MNAIFPVSVPAQRYRCNGELTPDFQPRSGRVAETKKPPEGGLSQAGFVKQRWI
ncbi:hypothetical protein [Variovorax sp. Root318D1]|uniref:hypothetical protein n=1 Tax=Variovorax sp. Root318D1 TaxID=1736513 RepID=UPI0012F9693C|nr:hypothetical protein [Variovorax sp. Root318D1]